MRRTLGSVVKTAHRGSHGDGTFGLRHLLRGGLR